MKYEPNEENDLLHGSYKHANRALRSAAIMRQAVEQAKKIKEKQSEITAPSASTDGLR